MSDRKNQPGRSILKRANRNHRGSLIVESGAKPLFDGIVSHNWALENTKNDVKAHLDFVKFGGESYGYGLGSIDMKAEVPLVGIRHKSYAPSKN